MHASTARPRNAEVDHRRPRNDSGASSAGERRISPRRQRLLERFDAADPKFLSLDVFDTLLCRPFERPTDVFIEIHRVLTETSDCALSCNAHHFAYLRIEAEIAARKTQPSSEVTLDEIARELSKMLGGKPSPQVLAQAELVTERTFIQLDHDVAALIRHAHARGVPYVLVSDMYMSSEQLLELLGAAVDKAGTDLPLPSKVFVSGERRTNKSTRMFDEITRQLGCASSEIFHVGDNERSDVEVPARKGVRTLHYFRETPYVSRVLDLETRHLSQTAQTHYDLGLRTLRSKALTSAMATAGDELRHFHYGAFVLGPLLTLFAEWVVRDCVNNGQDLVFCLMREGHLLAPLVEKAARAVDANLTVRPLWVSRYAVRAASYQFANEPELRAYFTKRHGVPMATIGRDLGLDVPLVRQLTKIRHDGPLSETEVDAVVQAVVGNRALRDQMLETSAEKRRRLFGYFEGMGVFSRDRLALVDLGWGGTIQRTMAQVFAARSHEDAPSPRHIRGLYLATHEKLLDLPHDSCSADSFLFHLAQPADSALLRRTPEILESACMAPQGSFMGIEEDGSIATFPNSINPTQLRHIAEIQRGIHHFADLWLPQSAARQKHISQSDYQAVLGRLRAILARSLQDPMAEEVALFADWEHDNNDGSAQCEKLLGDDELRRRAKYMSYHQILELTWLDCFWPQGLARLAGKTNDESSRLWRSALRYDAVRTGAGFFARSAVALSKLVGGK